MSTLLRGSGDAGGFDAMLAAARPADPIGCEAERAAVRVLARVAALSEVHECAAPRPGPKKSRGILRAAASMAVVAVIAFSAPWSSLPSAPPAPAPIPSVDPVRIALDGALAGDRTAAAQLFDLGPVGRSACLDRAALGGSDAGSALTWFDRIGGPRGADEALRVADLAASSAIGAQALDLLARAQGDSGGKALGDLLVDLDARMAGSPGGEEAVVRALHTVAAEGRPSLALEGLRRGASVGRTLAAAESLRLGGTSEVDRLLRTAGEDILKSDAVARALREAPDTVRQAWLSRVERGDARALAAASAARLPGLPAVLAPRLREAREAVEAVRAIAAVDGVEAWRVLPQALDGPADAEARVAIRACPAAAAHAFREAAIERGGASASPFLDALAEIGDAGLKALEELGERPALAEACVFSLSHSRARRASEVIASIGSHAAMALPAVEALARRLKDGDPSAADALLTLARGGSARAALEALAAAGDAGADALAAALDDPRLRVAATGALNRAEGPLLARLPVPLRAVRRARESLSHS